MTLLKVEGLTKSYPGVKAADGISFKLEPGEIHALLGENGAGKSTLVKMIYGVVRPDAGAMMLEGRSYHPKGPADARAQGIGMVFQHFSLFEAMSVEENVALGLSAEAASGDLAARIRDVSRSYGLDIAPDRIVGELSVGERQRIEIVRCLLQNPRLLIMDEPTSVLTPREANDLFRTLRQLASEGRSVLYISHKLEEIRSLCDRATVLRGGRVVGSAVPRDETAKALAEMMIGSSLKAPERGTVLAGPVRLRVNGLSVAAEGAFGTALRDISFEVRGGEILGIAGVAGNGQTELMDALAGEVPALKRAAIEVDGVAVGDLGPTARRARGMAFVPEERLGHGAVPGLSLTENMILSSRGAVSAGGMIDWAAAEKAAEGIVARFDVRTAGVDHAARSLSGGNLQKFVVGREMALGPGVFIASQPTWGVDAGAAAEIHKAVIALARAGSAVVLISQDLDELFQVVSHLAVIAGGRMTPARPIEQMSIADIGLAMEGRASAPTRAEAHHV